MGRIRAWHFLPMDGKTQHRNRRLVEVGKTYSCRGNIEPCVNGMHGSRRIIDALYYSPGPVACYVRIWGNVKKQRDKLAGRHRKVLGMANISDILHRFACQCATESLEFAGVTDERCFNAIYVKLRWLDGDATNEELDAAISSAWAAASGVRLPERDAVWAAARAADDYPAWAIVPSVVWLAVNLITRQDPTRLAWNAEWNSQNKTLTRMVESVL